MFYLSVTRLSADVGSGTVTCHMAPNLTSRLRWAPALPCVIWSRTLPSDRGGLRRCQVSYGSGSHLPIEVGSGAVTYPVAPCGPRASSIKKSLAVMSVQLDTYVLNARAQVSKVHDSVCKTCGHATQSMPTRRANMQLQCD
jgi:hypothetical protein